MGRDSDGQFFENYLKLLDLRLVTLLAACPEETRGEVLDRLIREAESSGDDLPEEISGEDLQGFAAMADSLTAAQKELREELARTGAMPRIELLRERFDLDADELLLLTAVLAASLDENFRRIYRLFQNSEEPRMDLLLRIITPDGTDRFSRSELLGPEGKLLSCCLIETVGNVSYPGPLTAFRPAPGLLAWLGGKSSTDFYQGRADWTIDFDRIDEKGDYYAVSTAIEAAELGSEAVPLISFYGPDAEILMSAAAELAAELERPFLRLDLHGLEPAEALPLLRFALRDGVMNRGLVVLTGLNQWIDSGAVFPSLIAAFFEKWQVPIILLTNRAFVFSPLEIEEKRLVMRVSVEGLTGSRRYNVWRERVRGLPLQDGFDEEGLRTLAGQFILNSSQIRSAVNYARGIALTAERKLSLDDLYAGARMSSMHHLSDLAKRMESRYTLKDLVLPEKQAAEIDALIAMARNRSLVLEDWGVGKKLVSGKGISALFTGVPGTGKTLSAQAIAGELGLELYRVDLSTIVSKYIGETEKNLERVFTEAQNSNVILFFDEADSLFGRRSDVGDSHDRYANIEVGYLLQRIETYDGIVLMATNLGANLDEAFARRIHFIIDFPFPDEATRLRLWKLLLPDNIEKEPGIDLEPFALAYKIAGGGIRNAVVWAIYEAARNKRPLNREDLLHGVEREYQKMGKVFIALR